MNSRKMDPHSETFLHSLMRKQLRLSITCAASFLVVLLGLPLANYLFPDLMAKRIFGFTLSWFFLGIGFFPAVWIISFYFIRRSISLEEQEIAEVKGEEITSDSAGRSSPGSAR
jgi:putative solute:sodium symporter small subunit